MIIPPVPPNIDPTPTVLTNLTVTGTLEAGSFVNDSSGIYYADANGLSPDLSDNYAPLNDLMDIVSSNGGGTIIFGPGTYYINKYIVVPDGVAFQGVKDSTVFNFVNWPIWEHDILGGLVRAMGSLGTPQALTVDVEQIPTICPRFTATRSGTVATATCDYPHGLAAGDPVWTTGTPTVGNNVFLSVKGNAVARTTPFTVLNVIDPLTFTYTVQNTGDTTLSGGIFRVRAASDVLCVTDTSPYAAEQDIQIYSSAYRTNITGNEMNHIGEFARIARVLSSTRLMLYADVQDNYLVSDSAQVVPVTFQRGFSFTNIKIVSKGANPGPGEGDRGILAYLCDDPKVTFCHFQNVDYTCVYIFSCMGGAVSHNNIVFDASDEAGQSSGALDIQYGVAYGGSTTGPTIDGNVVWGGRHAVVESMTNSSSYHGVARNVSVVRNDCHGQWLTSISTHQGSDNLVVAHNFIHGSLNGINIRYGRDTLVNDNVIDVENYGILLTNYIGNITLQDNIITASVNPIFIDQTLTGSPFGQLVISDNNTIGGEQGIYVLDSVSRSDAIIKVGGNTITGTKSQGIWIAIGSVSGAADGWYGTVSDNILNDVGKDGVSDGMSLQNQRGGSVNNNAFIEGTAQLVSAIAWFGAGAALVPADGNSIPDGLCTGAPLRSSVPGYGDSSVYDVVISSAADATFDFTGASLPAGAALTRASTGEYFDNAGTLQSAAIDVARFTYDPTTHALQGLLAEAAATNSIRNSVAAGSVAGSPGTLPTHWIFGGNLSTLTRTVGSTGTEGGINYIDIQLSGTPAITSSLSFEFEVRNFIAAVAGDSWVQSFFVKLVAGSMTNLSAKAAVSGRNSSGTVIEESTLVITPTGSALGQQRNSASVTMASSSTAFVNSSLRINYTSGLAVNATFRIGLPNLCSGTQLSSPIITSGVTVTRDPDILSLTVADGLYGMDVVELSGTARLVQSSNGGAIVVPSGASPVQTISVFPPAR